MKRLFNKDVPFITYENTNPDYYKDELSRIIDDNAKFQEMATAKMTKLQAEIARLTDLNKRLKEDAERLALTYVIEVFPHEWVCRGGCHHWARFGEHIDHAPNCPITLHLALMAEMEEK